ncbi:putative Ser/Thr protein kinase [Geoglobus ahangari]|uniref:Putative Ser/Thr protein kinase n=1 Tax=Geoglobus ahangari TaxID=113653 RepID=A0A0F7IHV0_9EURY|nr:hypothetical protein [Geoglobus ahangari]AKG92330.1 putative Ser/Thr protein kinase [Geoglobus ahangari]
MRGRHSEIVLRGDRVIKRFRRGLEYNFWKEARVLTMLQPFSFVPKLYSVRPSELEIEMEFVQGTHLGEVLDSLRKREVEKILDICRTLDRLGIQKEEMNHPDRHVILSERVVFVDFERSVFKNRPSNLTQFAVYLNTRLRLMGHEELAEILRAYKRDFSEGAYREVKGRILELFG